MEVGFNYHSECDAKNVNEYRNECKAPQHIEWYDDIQMLKLAHYSCTQLCTSNNEWNNA